MRIPSGHTSHAVLNPTPMNMQSSRSQKATHLLVTTIGKHSQNIKAKKKIRKENSSQISITLHPVVPFVKQMQSPHAATINKSP